MVSTKHQNQKRAGDDQSGSAALSDNATDQSLSSPFAQEMPPKSKMEGFPSPTFTPTYYPNFLPQPPALAKTVQRILAALLKLLLLPPILLGVSLWPFLAITCAVPIVGVMAIPLLILLSVVLLYSIAWLAYLFLAQPDLPAAWTSTRTWSFRNLSPFLPFSPMRCAKVDLAAIRYVTTAIRIAFPAVLDWSYRRFMVMGTQKGTRIVKEGILYGSPSVRKRLDIYFPATVTSPSNANLASRPEQEPVAEFGPRMDSNVGETPASNSNGAPVIVVVPSVMAPIAWTWKRKLYLQLALRLRRMGYCVVVPDITYYPESRIKSSIIDLRLVLRWTFTNCQRYGGDPTKIHVMGHGLSAHLIMLTVAQEAVVLSREGHLDRAYERQSGLHKGKGGNLNREKDQRVYDESEDEEEWTKSGEVGDPSTSSDTSQPAVKETTGFGDNDRDNDGRAEPVTLLERSEPAESIHGDGWVDEPEGPPPGAVMGAARRFTSSRDRTSANNGSSRKKRSTSFRQNDESENIFSSNAYRKAEEEVGNGLKRVEIYEPEIELPPLAGIILLSGISDVIKGFRSESEKGLEHLSFLRRSTGPSHIQCLLHSPAHLLYAAKNIIDTRLLPPKFLLIHGGKDSVVPVEQSTLLKTLLVGIGVGHVRLRAYRNLGHAESMACLFLGIGKSNTRYTRQILEDITTFVPP